VNLGPEWNSQFLKLKSKREMGRKKASPARLPASTDVSLSAFEVRLASDSASKRLFPFGEDPLPLGDEDEEEDDETNLIPIDSEDIDGAPFCEKEEEHPLKARKVADRRQMLVSPAKEALGLVLAKVEINLTLPKEASNVQSVALLLERKDQITDLKFVNLENPSEEFFVGRGTASFGANEDQIDAIMFLTSNDLITCPAKLEAGTLRCSISVRKDLVKDSKSEALHQRLSSHEVKCLNVLMEWLFPGAVTTLLSNPKKNLALDPEEAQKLHVKPVIDHLDVIKLFSRIRPSKTCSPAEAKLVSKDLTATLRPYQRRALRWMLEREGAVSMKARDCHPTGPLDLFFCSYFDANGQHFEYSPFNACFATEGMVLEGKHFACYLGGILADEMGLGKTVEVLALIVGNREVSNIPADPFQNCINEENSPDIADCQCVCGHSFESLPRGQVQCQLCGAWQHVLCSCLNNANLKDQVHVCTSCRSTKNESNGYCKTTLIVCPSSIQTQWVSEVNKHTKPGSVSIFVYDGVKIINQKVDAAFRRIKRLQRTLGRRKKLSEKEEEETGAALDRACEELRNAVSPLWPQYLAQFDIVVTTYDALRMDLNHVQNSERPRGDQRFRLRFQKKYVASPSPLTALKWRRVCLDEAQEVESSAAAATEMANELNSKYRWCVTGTPVGRHGLEDLRGLVTFLRCHPIDKTLWWKDAIVNPLRHKRPYSLQRLAECFRPILWRNSKQDVRHELMLPVLAEHVHRLTLAPIEEHFYRKQHAEVANVALVEDRKDITLSRLLRLRQACCHPSIGSGGLQHKRARKNKKRRRGEDQTGHSADTPMTMAEIHKLLLSKAKIECEEAQRLLHMNQNAVAGIKLLLGEADAARELYETVLRKMDSNEAKNICRTDPLQRLHTLEGLKSILVSCGSQNVTKSAHIDRLTRKIDEIRLRFMMRFEMEVMAAMDAFRGKVEALGQIPADCENWWISTLTAIEDSAGGKERSKVLLERMRLDRNSGGVLRAGSDSRESIVFQFGSLQGLRMVLQREMEKISKAREEFEKAVNEMSKKPTKVQVMESADCSVCRFYLQKAGPQCENCKNKKAIVTFENLIFSFRGSKREASTSHDEEEEEEEGFYQYRDPGEVELILRIIKMALKSLRKENLTGVLVQADKGLQRFELMAAEISTGWALWRKRDAWLKAFDELDMATLRMRFQLPGEELHVDDEQWKINPDTVYARLAGYELECARFRVQLNQCISQLKFLENIKEKGFSASTSTLTSTSEGIGANESCPICHDAFEDKFVVLPCGHTLCLACIRKLKKVALKCPSCRTPFSVSSLRYGVWKAPPSSSSSSSDASLLESGAASTKFLKKEGVGTKLDAVVNEILRIEKADPSAKCLVFSQWDEALAILEHGLKLNDVSFVRIKGKVTYNERLMIFRRDPSIRAMLMNLSFGSKGLNVTEACHVLLIEPLMNTAMEAQAIGRIHRMGQTKETHVHHFIVQNTVEEKIYRLFRMKRLESAGNDIASECEDAEEIFATADISSREREEISIEDMRNLFES